MTSELIPVMAAVLLLLMIFFYNNFISAVEGAFLLIFSPSRARDVTDTLTFKRSSILSFMISIPVFAFSLTSCKLTGFTFLWTTIILAICFVIVSIANAILSTLDSRVKFTEEFQRSNNTFVIISLLSIPATIYSLVIKDSGSILPFVWIASISAIFVSVRLFYLIKKIFSLKFSHFFMFLYLCGLKILPIVVAVKVLVY